MPIFCTAAWRLTLSLCSLLPLASASAGPAGEPTEQVALTSRLAPSAADSPGVGMLDATLNPHTQVLAWCLSHQGLAQAVSRVALGGPQGVVMASAGAGDHGLLPNPLTGSSQLSAAQAEALLAGRWTLSLLAADGPLPVLQGQVHLRP